MTKIYNIIQHDEITEIVFTSPPGVSDLVAASKDHAGPEVRRKRLWDMSCGYDVSTQELNEIAQTGRTIELPVGSKVAVVAPDDLSFGITRMYSVYRNDSRSQHQIFRSRDEAIAWLNEALED